MTIAIIGARELFSGQSQALKNYLTKNYGHATKVISGGANGTDAVAEYWADEHSIKTEIYLPCYLAYGRNATHVRNAEIVSAVKAEGGILIAYQPNGATNGTQGTIQKARKAGIEVIELDVNLQNLQAKPSGSPTLF